jgi:hypothetical protein
MSRVVAVEFAEPEPLDNMPVVAETALAPFAAEAALPLLAAGIVLLLVLQVAGAAVEMKDAVVTENLAV